MFVRMLRCLSRPVLCCWPFWLATCVGNFRTFTIYEIIERLQEIFKIYAYQPIIYAHTLQNFSQIATDMFIKTSKILSDVAGACQSTMPIACHVLLIETNQNSDQS